MYGYLPLGMKRAALGSGGLAISRVTFGCMAPPDQADRGERERVLHAAFDAGITSFDTAPLYGFGASEEILGRAFADRRGRIEILTKVGLRWDGTHGDLLFEFTDPAGRPVRVRKDARPSSIEREVEQSLRRLGVEVIDLLQVHHRDVHTPLELTLEALAALRRAGKIRGVGLSNHPLPDIERATAATTLDAVQMEYNLAHRRVEGDLLPFVARHGVGFLAYSATGLGVLAGRLLGGGRPTHDRWGSPYFAPRNVAAINVALTEAVLPLARARGVTVGQVCLAWLLGQRAVTAAIAGARTAAQAQENAAAADLVLAPDEEARVRRAFELVDVTAGVRTRLRQALGRLFRP